MFATVYIGSLGLAKAQLWTRCLHCVCTWACSCLENLVQLFWRAYVTEINIDLCDPVKCVTPRRKAPIMYWIKCPVLLPFQCRLLISVNKFYNMASIIKIYRTYFSNLIDALAAESKMLQKFKNLERKSIWTNFISTECF